MRELRERGRSFNEIVHTDESNERHKGSRVMCVRLKKNLKHGCVARIFIFYSSSVISLRRRD